jgi:hypothetical protein
MKKQQLRPIFLGDTIQQQKEQGVKGEYVTMLGDTFYKIHNYDAIDPFFMSIVSSSDHWIFISSTGGLSAGRVSAEQSLFPYYTDDKLTENSENTGNKAIFLVTRDHRTSLWEPFSERGKGIYQVERNIYKNTAGSVVVFEENNHSLGLTYRYAWRTSDVYGFVKTSWIFNSGESSSMIECVDGLQNILPANVSMATQNTFSCLLDAYKRSELQFETGLAIFALNSTLTDLAEPSESLMATTVFQLGLDQVGYLLSSSQLDQFRNGLEVVQENEVLGQRCAYFVHSTFDLAIGAEITWHLVAEVSQDSAAIIRLSKRLQGNRPELVQELEADITRNNTYLEKIVANADGLQVSNHHLHCAHHFANVLFNGMRGGIFSNQYCVQKADFLEFISMRNRRVLVEHEAFFSEIPSEIKISSLLTLSVASGVSELIRLTYAYLPLSFSRRHGDPSRPWNRFTINIKKPDGTQQVNYEGNWRDIFQNWEALAYSYPEYIENMIITFLNATTVDGYNPYRISRQGIDWEIPEPHNPWSNIGYWSDHQIIYLQKLMEISARMHPGKLIEFLGRPMFSYANIPYRIKPYTDLLRDPYNTIDFDWDLEDEIEKRVRENGTDGKLVYTREKRVLQVSLAEKLLTLLLAKLANFVPEGGIWMNTQRPEWNDANNALVGKGLSVVTLCYLRRFIEFFKDLLEQSALSSVQMNIEVQRFYAQVSTILDTFRSVLAHSFDDEQRRAMMDALGQAGSNYRWNFYTQGLSGETIQLQISDMTAFLDLALIFVEHSLRANKRSDGLFHAYNILHLDGTSACVGHLYEMLEGQVAILSSGLLSGEESLRLLESLRLSQLYRPDQHTYILYPDHELVPFLKKNCMTPDQVRDLALISELVKAQNRTLIIRDEDGNYHFSGHIHNIKDVTRSLEILKRQAQFEDLVRAEATKIEALFETVFHHSEFTGRSGTFFAYEGLGSIYWHMVSKLLLAVQETILCTRNQASVGKLLEKYADIRKGQCFNKPPDLYGAFPTDPYSHTPKGKGAKQPGMTGMVKEEILARQAELGFTVKDGQIVFDLYLFDPAELLTTRSLFSYLDVQGKFQQLALEVGTMAYTICQTPIILQSGTRAAISVQFPDGSTKDIEGHVLDEQTSRHIFQRDGRVQYVVVAGVA